RMSRENLIEKIELTRISFFDTRAFVKKMYPFVSGVELAGEELDNVAKEVFEDTEGNPFFIQEIVKARKERTTSAAASEGNQTGMAWKGDTNALQTTTITGKNISSEPAEESRERRDEKEVAGSKARIPRTIYDLILRRLDRLEEKESTILSYAAVIGREFDLKLLCAATGIKEEEVLDSLDSLISKRLIKEGIGRSEDFFTFEHAKIQEVAYSELSRARRKMMHRKVAEAVEKSYHTVRKVFPLAYHTRMAMEWQAAFRWNMSAYQLSLNNMALETAKAYLEHARTSLINLHGSGSIGGEDKERIERILFYLKGTIDEVIGEWDSALREFAQASKEGPGEGPWDLPRAVALRGLGKIHYSRAEFDKAVEMYEKGMKILRNLQAQAEKEKCMSRSIRIALESGKTIQALGLVAYRKGSYTDAKVRFTEALSIVEAVSSQLNTADTKFIGKDTFKNSKSTPFPTESTHKDSGTHNCRWEDWMCVYSDDSGDAENEDIVKDKICQIRNETIKTKAELLLNLGSVMYRESDFKSARTHYEEALRMFTQAGDEYGTARTLHRLGMVYDKNWRLEEAEDAYRRSIDIFSRTSSLHDVSIGNINLGIVLLKKGNLDRARECFLKSKEITEKLGDNYGLAISYGLLGRVESSRFNHDIAISLAEMDLARALDLGSRIAIAYAYQNVVEALCKANICFPYATKSLKRLNFTQEEMNALSRCLGTGVRGEGNEILRAAKLGVMAVSLFSELKNTYEAAKMSIMISVALEMIRDFFKKETTPLELGLEAVPEFGWLFEPKERISHLISYSEYFSRMDALPEASLALSFALWHGAAEGRGKEWSMKLISNLEETMDSIPSAPIEEIYANAAISNTMALFEDYDEAGRRLRKVLNLLKKIGINVK
ncbi:MAG: tetratricopeptide repeat protein, partial [Thermoplasmata archaeon]